MAELIRKYIADLYIGDHVRVGSNMVDVVEVDRTKITVRYSDGSQMTVNPKTHVVKG